MESPKQKKMYDACVGVVSSSGKETKSTQSSATPNHLLSYSYKNDFNIPLIIFFLSTLGKTGCLLDYAVTKCANSLGCLE